MKITTKFLWWPKTIQGETRWLERATWIGRVCTLESTRTHESVDFQWTDERWLDTDEEVELARREYRGKLKMWDEWEAGR